MEVDIFSGEKAITPHISVKTAMRIVEEHNRQIEYLYSFTEEAALGGGK
jgi:hypothetical protein